MGRVAMSSSPYKQNYLIYSDSLDTGMLRVFNLDENRLVSSFEAHESPVLKVSVDYYGKLAATCSCRGTIVRVWAIPSG